MKNKKIIIVFSILIFLGTISIFIIDKIQSTYIAPKVNLSEKAYYLEDYLKNNENDIDGLLELALTYSNNNNFDKSIDTYLKLLNINNNIPLAWQRLGNVYVRTSEFNKAISAYNKAIELEPNNASAYHLLSQVLLLSDINKSENISNKFLKISETNNEDNIKFAQDYYTHIHKLMLTKSSESSYEIYFNLLNDDYFITFDELKLALINNIIASYPNEENIYKDKLLTIKHQLETQLSS